MGPHLPFITHALGNIPQSQKISLASLGEEQRSKLSSLKLGGKHRVVPLGPPSHGNRAHKNAPEHGDDAVICPGDSALT